MRSSRSGQRVLPRRHEASSSVRRRHTAHGNRAMTELLYLADSYLRSFDATVTEVTDDGALILDQSVFYPTGGGQPHDTGTLTAGAQYWQVVNVAKRGAETQHI